MVLLKVVVLFSIVLQGGDGVPSSIRGYPQAQTGANSDEDRAGPYVITNQDANTGVKDAQIRTFLWEHWRNHRRGRLVEKRYSKEGIPASTTFVIEPNNEGAWSLLVVTHWPPTKGSTPEHNQTEYRAFSVRRIEPHRDPQLPAIFVSDEETRAGDTYWLVFYDQKGKEVSAR